MSYKLIWEGKGVIKRYFGNVTAGDMLQSVREVEGDERFDRLRWVINDFLPIEGVRLETINEEVIDELAAIDKAASTTNANIRIAVVTTHMELRELASQYANSDMNVYPTKVFKDLDEARIWLRLPALDQ